MPEPGAAVSPGTSSCIFVNAPGLTVIAELEAESASTSPEFRWATSVSDSAFVYWTVASVSVFVPAVIVPLLLEIVPVPDGFSWIAVFEPTLTGLP